MKNDVNEYGRGGRTRTGDLTVPNRALYQLSHTPMVISNPTYILFLASPYFTI